MKIDKHHILEKKQYKKKGKYPEWIHSDINMIDIEHYKHINEVHAPSTNKKGQQARERVYIEVMDRLNFNIFYNTWRISVAEKIVIQQVYYWCLVQSGNKSFKNVELLDKYQKICERIGQRDSMYYDYE